MKKKIIQSILAAFIGAMIGIAAGAAINEAKAGPQILQSSPGLISIWDPDRGSECGLTTDKLSIAGAFYAYLMGTGTFEAFYNAATAVNEAYAAVAMQIKENCSGDPA